MRILRLLGISLLVVAVLRRKNPDDARRMLVRMPV